MTALLGNYRYIFRNIPSTIITILKLFYIGDYVDTFSISQTQTTNTIIVVFSFMFIFGVVLTIPSLVTGIMMDSLRKLRLATSSMNKKQNIRNQQQTIWYDITESIIQTLLYKIYRGMVLGERNNRYN